MLQEVVDSACHRVAGFKMCINVSVATLQNWQGEISIQIGNKEKEME